METEAVKQFVTRHIQTKTLLKSKVYDFYLNPLSFAKKNNTSLTNSVKSFGFGNSSQFIFNLLQSRIKFLLESFLNSYDFGLDGRKFVTKNVFLKSDLDLDSILEYINELFEQGFSEVHELQLKLKKITNLEQITAEELAEIIAEFYSIFPLILAKLDYKTKTITINFPALLEPDKFLKTDENYRKHVCDLGEYLKKNTSWAFETIFLHGSLATEDYIKGCSDLDVFSVVKKEVVTSPKKLLQLRNSLKPIWKFLYRIDPLQHHGIMLVSEFDTEYYPQHFFPLVLFDNSKILWRQNIKLLNFKVRESSFENLMILFQILYNFQSSLSNNFTKLNVLEMKRALQIIILFPAIFYQAQSNHMYKRESIPKFFSEFDNSYLKVLEKASKIRAQNLYYSQKCFDYINQLDESMLIDDWLIEFHKTHLDKPPNDLLVFLGSEITSQIKIFSDYFSKKSFEIFSLQNKKIIEDQELINNINWENVPKKFEDKDYDNTKNEVSKKLAELGKNFSIYEQGNISSPGISDIDLILVLNEKSDNSNLNNLKKTWQQLSEQSKYLCYHLPFFIPKNMLSQIQKLWPVSNLKPIFGEYDKELQIKKTPDWKPHLLTTIDSIIFNNFLYDFISFIKNGKIDIRLTLSRAHSLCYSIKILNENKISSKGFDEFISKVDEIRKNWFSMKTQNQKLETYGLLLDAINVELEIIDQLRKIVKNFVKYPLTTKNDVLGIFDDSIIFINNWDKEKFLEILSLELTKSNRILIPLPAEFLFILAFYQSKKGILGENLKTRLIHNLDLIKIDFSESLSSRINLIENNIALLHRTGINSIILPFSIVELSNSKNDNTIQHNLLSSFISQNPNVANLLSFLKLLDQLTQIKEKLEKQLNDKIREKDSLSKQLNDKIREKDSLSKQLNDKIREKDSLSKQLNDKIREKDLQISELRTATENYQNTITEIHQSFVLRMLHKYDKTMGKVIPLRPKKYLKPVKKHELNDTQSEVLNTVKGHELTKKDIVCFPITNWDFRYQRSQHLMTKFADKGHRVFYLTVNLQKLEKPYKIKEIKKNIYQLELNSPKFFDIYKDQLKGDLLTNIINSFKMLQKDLKLDAISFVQFPTWAPLVIKLKKHLGFGIIFDCLDDFTSFSNVIKEREKEEITLFKNSDLVTVTSSFLLKKAMKETNNPILIPNAGEFEHFASPKEHLLQNYKKPIIGYFGAIADWFDTKLLEFLTEKKPEWTFVLIGHTYGSDIRRLQQFKNVHSIGERPYSELPNYLADFDVCLIPFVKGPLIEATHPVKIYEYFAAGKPVVATYMPELLPISNLCYLSKNNHEFLSNIETALSENDKNITKKRKDFASKNTWNHRFEKLYNELKKTKTLDIENHSSKVIL